jgi:hypothetical protein
MLSEAKWFFELGKDRYKMVSVRRAEDATSISVVVYDDLGIEVSQYEKQIHLQAPFTCTTSAAEVSFESGGRIYRF